MAALGAVMALVAAIMALVWRKKEGKQIKEVFILLAAFLGIAGVMVFQLTEKTGGRMVVVDLWTIVNAAIFLAGIICLILGFSGKKAGSH